MPKTLITNKQNMGSSLSKISDDYDNYLALCKKIKIKEQGMENMYEHEKQLMKKYGYEKTYWGYQKITTRKKTEIKMSKEYKFKHDKNIIAFISYPWSKKALVMNIERVVICKIPVSDVTKSKSWTKIKQK